MMYRPRPNYTPCVILMRQYGPSAYALGVYVNTHRAVRRANNHLRAQRRAEARRAKQAQRRDWLAPAEPPPTRSLYVLNMQLKT